MDGHGAGARVTEPAGRARARPAAVVVLAAVLGGPALGCHRELSMARAHDDQRAATTIRYRGVRGDARLYPDYGSIDASILAPTSASELTPPRDAPERARRTP